MIFLGITPDKANASFTNIGKGRKVLLWRHVDNAAIGNALSEISKGKTIDVTFATPLMANIILWRA
jgi:hypothetical protein